MNNLVEQTILKRVQADYPPMPDFEEMWQRIDASSHHHVLQKASDIKYRSRYRKRLTLAVVAISSVIIMAPVVAGMSMGWQDLFGRLGITTAMNNGFGNPLDINIQSGGTTLSLKGVVADDERMDILFTMEVPGMPDYDAVQFERKVLSGSGIEGTQLIEIMKREASSNRLVGLLETENLLNKGKETYDLSLHNLQFFKYKQIPLQTWVSEVKAGDIVDSTSIYGQLQIVSVELDNGKLTLRYELPYISPDAAGNDPKLQLLKGDETIFASYSAVLPSDHPDLTLRQDTFLVNEASLDNYRLQISYLDMFKQIEGNWQASFEADGKKAREATYRKTIQLSELVNSDMDARELVVTPTEIRLMLHDNFASGDPNQAWVHYDKKTLMMDGQAIEGRLWRTEKSGWYIRFEAPEWYQDWSNVPMKLLLSEAWISKRSTELWLTLDLQDDEKRNVRADLDGYPVTFTYYKEGTDLIVESYSDNDKFMGISQTAVKKDGIVTYPEMNPTPPGGNGSNKKVDRYPDLLTTGGDIQLSPGFYRYLDPERKAEVTINK
ncbi:DUF4179 domain-containing protein [Paenibacillus sedimenti]|uniref:DUF4179 domain-containing protein n=1 Tax=Paenibacillus sedimenti TaxID=2770274 RepID=A0A926KKB6_9BACL|nr:DUF4179 domain-containing protein [Paenibacillus sedimenti]MBD0378571.1 DUF4179 domain-containing protein [Paenibacillus sedimenti]